jgi:DNA-binding response OmpR family regulator
MSLQEAACIVKGLELLDLVERKAATTASPILVVEDDPETASLIERALGPDGSGLSVKVVRDRIAAQLLLRRQSYKLAILAIDRPEQEAFFRSCKEQFGREMRLIGMLKIDDEDELARLDAMGLDGVLHRPLSEADLKTTVNHLLDDTRSAIAIGA